MKTAEKPEPRRIEAQTLTPGAYPYWDFGDGLIPLPEGWDLLHAKQYYIDVDAVLDEANAPH